MHAYTVQQWAALPEPRPVVAFNAQPVRRIKALVIDGVTGYRIETTSRTYAVHGGALLIEAAPVPDFAIAQQTSEA